MIFGRRESYRMLGQKMTSGWDIPLLVKGTGILLASAAWAIPYQGYSFCVWSSLARLPPAFAYPCLVLRVFHQHLSLINLLVPCLSATFDINDPQPEEVQLTLVGEVSHDGTWLLAEGAYRPGLKLNPGNNITGAKAKFELIAQSDPKLTVFRHDWEMYMANIRAIHEAALKDKGQHSNCWDPVQNRPIRLTIRHPLIIERTESNNGDDLTEQDNVRQLWCDELDEVKATHDINPLPAYDVDYSMIAPKDYEQCLLGAMTAPESN
ncbi:hypothetical protein JB92DRAFT_2832882 [Gautieria morchelliformis]|nr:hypothetical protein JB92DRAFT_2832882 [Gautieria morchelliformis]